MNKRQLLFVASTLLAGCAGIDEPAPPSDNSTSGDESADTAYAAAFSGTCDPARARDAVSPYQKAMLDTIATTEGTIGVSDDGYNEYFTGVLFSDCTRHPAIQHCAGSLCSDAAGRYQFLSTTWNGLGFPNFYPDDQDKGAVKLVTTKRSVALPSDRALSYNEFVAAMGSCNVSTGHGLALEWASLPPGCYGQPSVTMQRAWEIYSSKVAASGGGVGAGTVIELRANNGQYVSSAGGTSGDAASVYANRNNIGAWEKLRLVPGNGGFALACQGASGGRYYVSAENGGGGAVHCNRTEVGPWETFSLEWKSPVQAAFRTNNGHYLSAQNGGGAGVDATRTAVGVWETFAVEEGLPTGTCTSAEYAAQNLNGASFWTCQGTTRYICDGARHKIVEPCAEGCSSSGAGTDDVCLASSLPSCTSAEYNAQNLNGTSYWTCQGNSRYVCDGTGTKVTELCAAGCASSSSGVDDECR